VTAIIDALRSGRRIDEPVAVVAAHPDDETMGLGSRLRCFRQLRLIHLTDGAPLDMRDARRAGFADRAAYADAREQELEAALRALGAGGAVRIRYDAPDQQAIGRAAELTDRLARDLAGCGAVFTHAYEAGHPDHDTAALVVALARRRLADAAPLQLEFASYFLGDEAPVFGKFRPSAGCIETELPLGNAGERRKRAAIDCFASQREVLAQFPIAPERIRRAPRYRFEERPGPALYERWGFDISQGEWRVAAARLLEPAQWA
jgi:LmbE family N-acetylglucosaminyl deacetylase